NSHKNDACHENWVWNLADRVIYLLYLFPAIGRVVKTTAATQACEPCGKANNKPFFHVERLKENLLHQLERLAKGLKDLNFWAGSVHGRDCERVSSIESSSRMGCRPNMRLFE